MGQRWHRSRRRIFILCAKGNNNHELVTGFFLYIRESYKRLEFVSDRMSYIIRVPRGPWCDIVVPNVHSPTENKIEDMKKSFYEELERVFDKFPNSIRKFC
jgi:hypothetical protein